MSDAAFDPNGQYFFDIFDTDGFLGDVPLVNFAYAPVFEVLPRKYRFRILNACMSRFIQLQLADSSGNAVPFQFIANDGNLVVNPIPLTSARSAGHRGALRHRRRLLERSRSATRFTLVNTLQQTDGRMPSGQVSLKNALAGNPNDPMRRSESCNSRSSSQVQSVDVPGVIHRVDRSRSAAWCRTS